MSFLTDTALSHKKAMCPPKFEIWGDSKVSDRPSLAYMPPASHTGKRSRYVRTLSVREDDDLILWTWTCEDDIFKTILNRFWCKLVHRVNGAMAWNGQLWGSVGQRSRSQQPGWRWIWGPGGCIILDRIEPFWRFNNVSKATPGKQSFLELLG